MYIGKNITPYHKENQITNPKTTQSRTEKQTNDKVSAKKSGTVSSGAYSDVPTGTLLTSRKINISERGFATSVGIQADSPEAAYQKVSGFQMTSGAMSTVDMENLTKWLNESKEIFAKEYKDKTTAALFQSCFDDAFSFGVNSVKTLAEVFNREKNPLQTFKNILNEKLITAKSTTPKDTSSSCKPGGVLPSDSSSSVKSSSGSSGASGAGSGGGVAASIKVQEQLTNTFDYYQEQYANAFSTNSEFRNIFNSVLNSIVQPLSGISQCSLVEESQNFESKLFTALNNRLINNSSSKIDAKFDTFYSGFEQAFSNKNDFKTIYEKTKQDLLKQGQAEPTNADKVFENFQLKLYENINFHFWNIYRENNIGKLSVTTTPNPKDPVRAPQKAISSNANGQNITVDLGKAVFQNGLLITPPSEYPTTGKITIIGPNNEKTVIPLKIDINLIPDTKNYWEKKIEKAEQNGQIITYPNNALKTQQEKLNDIVSNLQNSILGLKPEVLKDLANEVNSINIEKFQREENNLGIFVPSNNNITLYYSDEDSNVHIDSSTITHEIGHAIDYKGITTGSQNQRDAFNELKAILEQNPNNKGLHILDNPQEFFAFLYDYKYNQGSAKKSDFIKAIENAVASNPNSKLAQLYNSLKNSFQNVIDTTRNLPLDQRKDVASEDLSKLLENKVSQGSFNQISDQKALLNLIYDTGINGAFELFEGGVKTLLVPFFKYKEQGAQNDIFKALDALKPGDKLYDEWNKIKKELNDKVTGFLKDFNPALKGWSQKPGDNSSTTKPGGVIPSDSTSSVHGSSGGSGVGGGNVTGGSGVGGGSNTGGIEGGSTGGNTTGGGSVGTTNPSNDQGGSNNGTSTNPSPNLPNIGSSGSVTGKIENTNNKPILSGTNGDNNNLTGGRTKITTQESDKITQETLRALLEKYGKSGNISLTVVVNEYGDVSYTVKMLPDSSKGSNIAISSPQSTTIAKPTSTGNRNIDPYDYIENGRFNTQRFLIDAKMNGWTCNTYTDTNGIKNTMNAINEAQKTGNWDDFWKNSGNYSSSSGSTNNNTTNTGKPGSNNGGYVPGTEHGYWVGDMLVGNSTKWTGGGGCGGGGCGGGGGGGGGGQNIFDVNASK